MFDCAINWLTYFAGLVAYPIVSGIDRIWKLAQYFFQFDGNPSTSAFQSLGRRNLELLNPSGSSSHISSAGKTAHLFLSLTGNPPHMGHLHILALAIEALVARGYSIGQVRIALSSEQYAQQKVHWQNVSIQTHNKKLSEGEKPEMLRVLLPREKRIDFIRKLIFEAKREETFEKSLDTDCWEDAPDNLERNLSLSYWNSPGEIFFVCGADFAEEKPELFGENQVIKRAVVIGREIANFPKNEENDHQIFIENKGETSKFSSSKIQNGQYELLPPCIREEFITLHKAVQIVSEKEPIEQVEIFDEEIEKIPCPIAKGTKKAITQGFYVTPSGKSIKLRSGKDLLEGTQVNANAVLEEPMEPRYADDTKIAVVKQDCLEAARVELGQGAEKLALLVLASPIEAGGGMEDGIQGQEEEVCRRSNLFDFMWDQSHFLAKESFYNLVDLQRADEKDPDYGSMHNNKMLHVPQVTVFRAGKEQNYQMLEEPFEVGMLISSGLNRPRYHKVGETWAYIRSQDSEQLQKLITAQLKAAYDGGYDTVILGAFGCGAFENPPELVASVYKEIIDQFFPKAFKRIVFAILEGPRGAHNSEGNIKPFQDTFSSPDARSCCIS